MLRKRLSYSIPAARGIQTPPPPTSFLSAVLSRLGGGAAGTSVIFKWRGKPVFIKRRDDAMIEREVRAWLLTLRAYLRVGVRVRVRVLLVCSSRCFSDAAGIAERRCLPLASV